MNPILWVLLIVLFIAFFAWAGFKDGYRAGYRDCLQKLEGKE